MDQGDRSDGDFEEAGGGEAKVYPETTKFNHGQSQKKGIRVGKAEKKSDDNRREDYIRDCFIRNNTTEVTAKIKEHIKKGVPGLDKVTNCGGTNPAVHSFRDTKK